MITAHTFRLDGRQALVTGASTGIGFALARALGQAVARRIQRHRPFRALNHGAAT